jgi:hypothetical protein
MDVSLDCSGRESGDAGETVADRQSAASRNLIEPGLQGTADRWLAAASVIAKEWPAIGGPVRRYELS